MNVEWDEQKEQSNIKKHGISFTTAAKVFLMKRFEIQSNKNNEKRYLAIASIESHIIAVVYTLRGDNYRIISARTASKSERKCYEDNCQT